MAVYKCTLIFNQDRNGWTETYYTIAATFAQATSYLDTMVAYRQTMLGKGSALEAYRLSDENVIGDALLRPIPWTDADGKAGVTDTPWNSALIRLEAGSLYRRSLFLRGLPDEWIQKDDVTFRDKLIPDFRSALDKFFQAITSLRPFHLKVLKKDNVSPNGVAITTLSADPVDNYTICTAPLHECQTGQKCLIRKFIGPDAGLLNRSWNVISVDGDAVKISLKFASMQAPLDNYNGKIIARNTDYVPITLARFMRFTSRKTGRAFFVSRGRRPKR